MQWLNEPASWQRTGDVLRVNVDPGTDFWRTTGYGYVHDNGHVYGDLLPGDLDVSVRVRGSFASQYDQAGIMLRADAETWLKTGLEFFEGRPRLSTVLTAGWSSWMVADLPPGTDEVTLRVSRRGDAVEVRYAAGDGAAELAALVFMPPDREMLAGIVCAAPEGNGFSVAFHDLRIVGREWGGQGADGADWAGGSAAPAAGWAQEQATGTAVSWTGDAEGWRDGNAESDDGAAGWAADKADDRVTGWTGDKTDDGAASGWDRETPGGLPAGWGDELPGNESVDWAKPLASEPAADWDRLSLSVSGSWNAFAAGEPAKEPAEEQPERPAGKPGTGKAAKAARAGRAGQESENGTGEPPEPPAKQDEPDARGRNGRGRKAKLPAPRSPVASAPADAADEWISLLTADSAEELSRRGQNRAGEDPARASRPQENRPGDEPARNEPGED
jgi:regulation of enolase protein 1 (concanavalin A-like superfamily)